MAAPGENIDVNDVKKAMDSLKFYGFGPVSSHRVCLNRTVEKRPMHQGISLERERGNVHQGWRSSSLKGGGRIVNYKILLYIAKDLSLLRICSHKTTTADII